MMDFKACLARDRDAVFLNQSEFADLHEINGKGVPCVVDQCLTSDYQDTVAEPIHGVFVNLLTIYAAAKDLEAVPVEGEILTFDGEHHFVRSVNQYLNGMLVITCEANAQ